MPLRRSMSSKSPLFFTLHKKFTHVCHAFLAPLFPPLVVAIFVSWHLQHEVAVASREGRRLLPPCLPPGPATIEPNNNRNHEARPLHSSCRFCCRFCSWCSGFPFGYPAARVQGAITKEIVAGYFRLSTLLSSSWFELQAAAVELAVRSAMTNILYHKIWVLQIAS